MLGKFSVKLLAVFLFLKSPKGIFAFRLGIVSVALWVPAVCHSSAWLYYDNRGVWALIMAQVCVRHFTVGSSVVILKISLEYRLRLQSMLVIR